MKPESLAQGVLKLMDIDLKRHFIQSRNAKGNKYRIVLLDNELEVQLPIFEKESVDTSKYYCKAMSGPHHFHLSKSEKTVKIVTC